jgi:hypothetical protein
MVNSLCSTCIGQCEIDEPRPCRAQLLDLGGAGAAIVENARLCGERVALDAASREQQMRVGLRHLVAALWRVHRHVHRHAVLGVKVLRHRERERGAGDEIELTRQREL